MESSISVVVGRDPEDIDTVHLDQVTGVEEVVSVTQLLLHARGSHDHRVRSPNPGDVLLGEVVVVGMGQKYIVSLALLCHSPWIHMDLNAFSAYSDRGLAEPGHSIQKIGHGPS